MPPKAKPIADRFWPRVKRGGENDCWQWLGQVEKISGYGFIGCGGTRPQAMSVHRLSYILMVGDIPEGLALDHLCRNRLCVNPKHLEAVTQRENILRGIGITAVNSKKTHCPKGHPYSGKNLMIIHRQGKNGNQRFCRECCNARNRERKRRKRNEKRSDLRKM